MGPRQVPITSSIRRDLRIWQELAWRHARLSGQPRSKRPASIRPSRSGMSALPHLSSTSRSCITHTAALRARLAGTCRMRGEAPTAAESGSGDLIVGQNV